MIEPKGSSLNLLLRLSLPALPGRRPAFFALLLCALLPGTLLHAGPAQAQISSLDDVVQFTQRAPATADAQSLGMAGAARAGRADGTALYYNPAGLGWMQTSMAGGALAFVGAEEEARFAGSGPTSESASDYGGHAALAYKFPTSRGSLVFAGAYNQVNTFAREFAFQGGTSQQSITRQTFLPFDDEYAIDGDFIEWSGSIYPQIAYEGGAIEYFSEDEEENLPAEFQPAVFEGTTVEQIGTVGSEGRLSEASLGAGVEAARDVMLGLSANIAFGRYDFSNAYSELDDGENDDYEVIRDGATYQGLAEVRLEEHFTSRFVGVNLRGGVSAQAAPGVRLGLTLETPTFYQVEETFTEAEVTTFFDDGGRLSYGGQPGDAVGTVENEYEVRTPWRFAAGAQVNLLPLTGGVADLTLAADAELVDWSQLERSSEAISLSDAQRINDDYEAVLNTNLGAEYRFAGVALRAGFAYRPDPRDAGGDGRTEPLEEAVASDRRFYSLGAGYRIGENIRVDAGWMQERFDDEFAIFPYGSDLVPAADEEVTRNRFVVGVRYSF